MRIYSNTRIAYIIISTEFAFLQAVLDEALAPFRRAGVDEFPRARLAFDDVTEVLKEMQAEEVGLRAG